MEQKTVGRLGFWDWSNLVFANLFFIFSIGDLWIGHYFWLILDLIIAFVSGRAFYLKLRSRQ